MKYTWLDFIWGANLQFGGGGLSPPSPWLATSLVFQALSHVFPRFLILDCFWFLFARAVIFSRLCFYAVWLTIDTVVCLSVRTVCVSLCLWRCAVCTVAKYTRTSYIPKVSEQANMKCLWTRITTYNRLYRPTLSPQTSHPEFRNLLH